MSAPVLSENENDVLRGLAAALGNCTDPADCPEGSSCEDGVCNHRDADGDACRTTANPEQWTDEDDDQDRDFIGLACESPTYEGCPRATKTST